MRSNYKTKRLLNVINKRCSFQFYITLNLIFGYLMSRTKRCSTTINITERESELHLLPLSDIALPHNWYLKINASVVEALIQLFRLYEQPTVSLNMFLQEHTHVSICLEELFFTLCSLPSYLSVGPTLLSQLSTLSQTHTHTVHAITKMQDLKTCKHMYDSHICTRHTNKKTKAHSHFSITFGGFTSYIHFPNYY